jgi:hypothetical protein
MKLILQEERFGCTIACMAMVLDQTYAQVRQYFETDFDKDGLDFEKIVEFLGDNGLSILHKKSLNYAHKDIHRKELFKPFAPAHIVRVLPQFDNEFAHVIAMDSKGKIFCPSGETDATIRSCYSVTDTIGLYK